MSSSDQAKSKLLDSMRMSKEGSTAETKTPANVKATSAKPATTKSTAAKKSKPASTKKTTSAKSATTKKPVVDNFQAAERVWPD